MQRRSSSAVTASQRQSVSCRNSLPVTLSGAKSVKSLERKRPGEGGLKKYSGSHSTSSIPRKVVKENAEKLKATRWPTRMLAHRTPLVNSLTGERSVPEGLLITTPEPSPLHHRTDSSSTPQGDR